MPLSTQVYKMGTGEVNGVGYPCDGLASHPGGIQILLVAYATETGISFALMSRPLGW